MLIGPPGVMKTTFINAAYQEWPNALVLSDINVNQLVPLRDDLISGRYRTIAFTAFDKLYQRHSSTSSNIEGHISALVEEGFQRASFEDQRMTSFKARCLVVGGLPYGIYSRKFNEWAESGFARRFLWCFIRLSDPEKIQDAIHDWKLIDMACAARIEPKTRNIPYNVTEAESRMLQKLVKEQPGEATPFILIKKIYCALKWKYSRKPAYIKHLLKEFAPCLTKNGGTIEL